MERIEIAEGEIGAESQDRALVHEVWWPWLLAVACALFLAEWYFYHRR